MAAESDKYTFNLMRRQLNPIFAFENEKLYMDYDKSRHGDHYWGRECRTWKCSMYWNYFSDLMETKFGPYFVSGGFANFALGLTVDFNEIDIFVPFAIFNKFSVIAFATEIITCPEFFPTMHKQFELTFDKGWDSNIDRACIKIFDHGMLAKSYPGINLIFTQGYVNNLITVPLCLDPLCSDIYGRCHCSGFVTHFKPFLSLLIEILVSFPFGICKFGIFDVYFDMTKRHIYGRVVRCGVLSERELTDGVFSMNINSMSLAMKYIGRLYPSINKEKIKVPKLCVLAYMKCLEYFK